MTVPVNYLADTPTLENAIIRVEMQFILDGFEHIRTRLTGNGRFVVETTKGNYKYEWSHVSGTQLVSLS